jgi:hypothetical protein
MGAQHRVRDAVSTRTQSLYLSPGGDKLMLVQFVAAAGFPYNGSNYYTVEVRVLRRGAEFPQQIGSILSLATRSLVAKVPIDLYTNDAGLRLNAGDELIGALSSAGTPAVLSNPSFAVEVQGVTR